jgi:hypothetical protein
VLTVLAALPAQLLSGRVVTGDALLANRALCRQMVRKGARWYRPEGESAADSEGRRASFADPWTPRNGLWRAAWRPRGAPDARLFGGSTEVVAYLTHPSDWTPRRRGGRGGRGGHDCRWPALAQVGRMHREVEYVSGAEAAFAGSGPEWVGVGLCPDQPAPRAGGCRPDAARMPPGWSCSGAALARPLADRERLALCALCARRDAGRGGLSGSLWPCPSQSRCLSHAALNPLRRHGATCVAAALRRHAMHPAQALALMGLHLHKKTLVVV